MFVRVGVEECCLIPVCARRQTAQIRKSPWKHARAQMGFIRKTRVRIRTVVMEKGIGNIKKKELSCFVDNHDWRRVFCVIL